MPAPAASLAARLLTTPTVDALFRVDLFAHAMNPGKEARLRALLTAWRRAATAQAAQQRQMLCQEGRVN
jgi:hypothetical protein